MKYLGLLLVIAGCGGGSSTTSDASSTTDGAFPHDGAGSGSGSGSGAGSGALPEVLVGTTLGSVRDFAIGPDALYPIVNLAGHYTLVRCPLTGCSTTPQVIAQLGTSTNGRGVVIAGSSIFWMADQKTIMRAALDGTGVAQRYQYLDGQIEYPLRASATKLYFTYEPASFKPVVVAMDADGSAAPTPITATQATVAGFKDEIDVSSGKLAFWHSQQGSAPQPIEVVDLQTNVTATVASSIDLSTAGFALATSGVVWIEDQANTADVRACLFGAPCDATTAGSPTFAALVTDGDQVFFSGRTSDNYATVVTCDVQSLAARNCVPTPLVHPVTPFDLLQLRSLKVTTDAVYAGTDPQGGGALWRIAR